VTLSIAIAVSLLVSLTTTPAMSQGFESTKDQAHGRLYRASEATFDWILAYTLADCATSSSVPGIDSHTCDDRDQHFSLHHRQRIFPDQDTGRLNGKSGQRRTSRSGMRTKLTKSSVHSQ